MSARTYTPSVGLVTSLSGLTKHLRARPSPLPAGGPTCTGDSAAAYNRSQRRTHFYGSLSHLVCTR
jgi:hypothetical protein